MARAARARTLRTGLTTGTCAAAAAKAATAAFSAKGHRRQTVDVTLPGGQRKRIPVRVNFRYAASTIWAEAQVIKDAGDDPDVTNGVEVVASVALNSPGEARPKPARNALKASDTGGEERLSLYGGAGVGKVTRPGLPVNVGEAAINPVPREMIRSSVLEVLPDDKEATVVISVPGGKQLARRTLNSRLGITGGISILGTTGIVVPMSQAAVESTIELEISMAAAEGRRELLFTPGRKGSRWAIDMLHLDEFAIIEVANWWGFALEAAHQNGIREILLAAHPSKLAKLAAGAHNSHSYNVEVPFRYLADLAAELGASNSLVQAIELSNTVEEFLSLIPEEENELFAGRFFDRLCAGVISAAKSISGGEIRIGVALYDRAGELLWICVDGGSVFGSDRTSSLIGEDFSTYRKSDDETKRGKR